MNEPHIPNRIVGFEMVDPADVLLNERNFRRHPHAQQLALDRSLHAYGWVAACVTNVRTGKLIDGEERCKAALRLGEAVPMLYIDVDPSEEAGIIASLDPISAMALTDEAELDRTLEEMRAADSRSAQELATLLDQEAKASMSFVSPPTESGDWPLKPRVPAIVAHYPVRLRSEVRASAHQIDRYLANIARTASVGHQMMLWLPEVGPLRAYMFSLCAYYGLHLIAERDDCATFEKRRASRYVENDPDLVDGGA